MSGELDRMPPTKYQQLTGDTGNRFLTPGVPHPGYQSRPNTPIGIEEIAAAKKAKAKRKAKKKMRKQSRKKK
jgi:hypothetical protein|uniref:Uncharacterized protein n=1 Tax=Myoviridae sp. ctshb19 TaxID=2825194 RepID=A0A8S5UGK8_9CAUD|nr:MAG TPA: hypothetical protein [Myoviridae sp. ctshb19]